MRCVSLPEHASPHASVSICVRAVSGAKGLRDDAGREAMIKRMWDSGILRVVDSVRSTVGLFTVSRPDGLQRLIVDPALLMQRGGPTTSSSHERSDAGAPISKSGCWAE